MVKKTKKTILFLLILIFSFSFIFLSKDIFAAWQAPTSPPPGNNINSPINAGHETQEKTGKLKASGAIVIGWTEEEEEGTLRFSSTTKTFYAYNGTDWIELNGTIVSGPCLFNQSGSTFGCKFNN